MNRDFNQSVEKCLKVISAFSADTPALTLAEVARLTGVNRAAARRIVLTLQELGYMGTRGRNYFLLPKILELGYSYLSSSGLAGVSQPHVDALATEVGEAVSVGVLSDNEVVYVARATGNRMMTLNARVGTKLDAVTTAIGRVLLAGLSDEDLDTFLANHEYVAHTASSLTTPEAVRAAIKDGQAKGWCAVNEEQEVGIRSIAVPVRDQQGRMVAAVNVGAHASRVSLEDLTHKILPRLQETAADISRDLRPLPASEQP